MADDRYRLANDPPPPRPRAGPAPPAPDGGDRPRPEPIDLFPVLLGGIVVVWVGLGLAARSRPWAGAALVAAGGVVIVVGQVYLLWLIHQDDPKQSVWAFLFDWYESIWCYLNMDVAWRPLLVSGCGLLMMVTGWAVGMRGR